MQVKLAKWIWCR